MLSLLAKIWKYVWPQMRKFRIAFFAIFLIFGIRTVLEHVIKPVFFKKIVDIISTTGLDKASIAENLLNLVFIFIGISIFATVLSRSTKFIYIAFIVNTTKELRDYCFEKLTGNSQTFFLNNFAGSLVTKARRFVTSFENIFDVAVFNFWSTLIVLIGVFIVLINESQVIALMFLLWATLYFLVILVILKRKVKYDLIEAATDSSIGGRLADVFSNILALKIFSSRKNEIASFKDITEDAAKKGRKAWFLGAKIEVIQAALSVGFQCIMLYVMVNLWLKGDITTGTIVMVQTFLFSIFEKMWEMSGSIAKVMKSAADMKELVDIFELVPDIQDPKSPEVIKIRNGHVVFKDVSFKYSFGQEVLSNFNLEIQPGERVGVVGHSGAGKSTVTKLLLRFNDVSAGQILVDGQDIRNITQDDLRKNISYVPQEPVLFHRTIRENISYSKPDATDEEITEVARKAHAHEFISKLPQGYNTFVGERGVKLSGGERQRIAIARAMLKDSPILVLDEATSSLDSVSESYIQDAFNKLMEDRTALVIAHRLSTIQKLDRIVVMENGSVIESGTHEELIKHGGVYKDLWEHQTGGFLE